MFTWKFYRGDFGYFTPKPCFANLTAMTVVKFQPRNSNIQNNLKTYLYALVINVSGHSGTYFTHRLA
jgi:hypothetical protein